MPTIPTVDDYVARLVAEAPPLTHEQRARLAEVLAPPKPAPAKGRAA